MLRNVGQRLKVRLTTSKLTETIGVHLKFKTYKRMKAKADAEYMSMSAMVRRMIGKEVKAEEGL